MRRLTLVFLAIFVPAAADEPPPPDKPKPGDQMIERYLKQEVETLEARYLDGARNKEEWEEKRGKLREAFLDMLGLWPLPEKTPLKAVVTGTLERDGFKVEKLHFQSRPGLYVTANLYLPAKFEGKLPAVLYLCGHSNKGRDGNKTAYQHHGIWFATNGYACLVLDTLQLGEIPGVHHGTYREGRWWWHSAGYTPAGVECWNGIRAIDYLLARPEVDPERLAVTGRSGGGAYTLTVAAADDRVRVAVPVSGLSDLECYVSDKTIAGHCDCMFKLNAYRWDWTTQAALIAPRPMLFLNSGRDPIFPMSGNERIRERLERVYRFYTDKPETLFDIGVAPGGHKDGVELRLMAYRWINRFLKKDDQPVREPELPVIAGADLRVFANDADLPRDAINAKIDETFVPRARVEPPRNLKEFDELTRTLDERLRQKVFREWPEQTPVAQLVREAKDGGMLLATEPGISVLAFRARNPETPKRQLLIVLGPEEAEDKIPDWAAAYARASDLVVLLSPRGCGGLAWTRKNPPNPLERSLALVGRTVDAGRVWDVQAAARWMHEVDENGLQTTVAGKGAAAILAVYAALFEPSIEELILVDPPASHRDGPHFLNVLRVLDIPDAIGMLAPRSVTIATRDEKPFERSKKFFAAAGAADKLKFK